MSTILVVLSWVIGLANCCSAIFTGPMLAWLLRKRPEHIRRAQGAGWLVLFAGQSVFWLFGFKSGLSGFLYAQPWMIPISLGNFTVWWLLGPHRDRHVARFSVGTRPQVAHHA